MSMSYGDCFELNVVSECCGASIYINGICAECKDHTEPAEVEEEDNYTSQDVQSDMYALDTWKMVKKGLLPKKFKKNYPSHLADMEV